MNRMQFHDTRKRRKMNPRLEVFLLTLATLAASMFLVANITWH